MIHGIINVYKEKGYTSHDVVAKLRGIAGQKGFFLYVWERQRRYVNF